MNLLLFLLLLLVGSTQGFQFPSRLYGEWILWHSTFDTTTSPKSTNRMVIHIYPHNKFTVSYRYTKGPIVYNRQKIGRYMNTPLETTDSKVHLHLTSRTDHLISLCGLGLHCKTKQDKIDEAYEVSMTCLGTDDIFLTDSNNSESAFHLVRSVRVVEPNIEVGLSSFLITQLLGIIINELLHIWLHMSL
jgi:hypothetical protein